MTLRELMFEAAPPLLETTGQPLRGVCECGEVVPAVGPDTVCTKCDLVRWACLRAETTGGTLYVATDAAMAKFARDGRTVIGQSAFAGVIERFAGKDPYDVHRWLKAYIR